MSNILVISTSLRPRSNSDILTERLVAGARDAGHQVEEISLKGKELKYCIGCLACQKTQRCVQKDDALWIADKMKDADTLVFSTPIYYYEMSGQMKTLLDRANPLYSADYAFREVWLLACAALFAVQILAVDHFVQRVDGLVLSCGQFLTAALLSAIFLGRETITGAAVLSCLWPLAYIAVLSSCVGYTLQTLAQRDGNPALVSLLLSLESFFAAVFGALLLHERLSARELLGCGLMLAAIVLAELPGRRKTA